MGGVSIDFDSIKPCNDNVKLTIVRLIVFCLKYKIVNVNNHFCQKNTFLCYDWSREEEMRRKQESLSIRDSAQNLNIALDKYCTSHLSFCWFQAARTLSEHWKNGNPSHLGKQIPITYVAKPSYDEKFLNSEGAKSTRVEKYRNNETVLIGKNMLH